MVCICIICDCGKIVRSARTFTDGKYVRHCMLEVAKIMLPDACFKTSSSIETVLQEE